MSMPLGPPPGQAWAGDTPNTLLLPLKVNAPAGLENLAVQADQALREVAAAKGMTMLERAVAEAQIDYRATWPPDANTFRAFSPPAGISYVAAGSLTKSGNKVSVDMAVSDLIAKTPPVFFYADGDSLDQLNQILDKVARDVLAYTGRYQMVAKISPSGNVRIDAGAILRHVKSREGDRYDPDLLREDLKSIFQMGFFDDVRIEVADSEKGKLVTFAVKEKALISLVSITGNKELEESDIRGVLTVAPSTIINNNEVRNSVEKIRKLYKEKGYYSTQVNANLSYPQEDRVEIRFAIEEGNKIFVKEVKITGNNTFKESTLKSEIETTEKGFFSWLTDSGVLKRDTAEQDAARLTAYYHNNGFIEAKVGEPEIVQEGDWLYVTFNIAEGDRYRVGTIDIDGDLIEDKATLLGMMRLGREEWFSRKTLRDDVLRLSDYYASKGYAFAEVEPSMERNPEAKTVTVALRAKKGDLIHINRIMIGGNTRTRDKVIRREMQIEEQGVFDASALRASHQKLQRLEFFEEVNLTPEPTGEEGLMDIQVEVKEKPTGAFSIGAGYSSAENLMFMAEISQNNFMGRGQEMTFQANISGSTTRYNFAFTEPHLGDSNLLAGFDLYNWKREYDDYTKDSKGFDVRLGHPLWKLWRVFVTYGWDDTDLEDVNELLASRTILDSMDIHVTSSVKVSFQYDSRDRLYDPSRGSHHVLSTKYAGGPLGGDSAFTKMESSTSWYFPFLWETTFHVKGAAGYVTENSDGKLPIYEHFYLGGISNIRGFKYGQVGEIDPLTGDKLGGDKMWYTNAEWIFPLFKEAGLKGLVFMDTGNVYGLGEDWDLSYIKKSVGLGFRWLSPMGPLRLEWGYNLDPVNDEDSSNWDFSIGGTF